MTRGNSSGAAKAEEELSLGAKLIALVVRPGTAMEHISRTPDITDGLLIFVVTSVLLILLSNYYAVNKVHLVNTLSTPVEIPSADLATRGLVAQQLVFLGFSLLVLIGVFRILAHLFKRKNGRAVSLVSAIAHSYLLISIVVTILLGLTTIVPTQEQRVVEASYRAVIIEDATIKGRFEAISFRDGVLEGLGDRELSATRIQSQELVVFKVSQDGNRPKWSELGSEMRAKTLSTLTESITMVNPTFTIVERSKTVTFSAAKAEIAELKFKSFKARESNPKEVVVLNEEEVSTHPAFLVQLVLRPLGWLWVVAVNSIAASKIYNITRLKTAAIAAITTATLIFMNVI